MPSADLGNLFDKNRALARELDISGSPGFIVGNELIPEALDLDGLKELIARGSWKLRSVGGLKSTHIAEYTMRQP
ncbi:MAG: hypothetical protein P0119_05725 [Nitrospira sp.]|nr:hypothetical protein [Nitrospira sp.]